MGRFRTLLLIVLVVSALPWGAYARALHQVGPAAPATTSSQQGVAAFAKHCRIATLPGAPCGIDQIILAAADDRTVPSAREHWPAIAGTAAREYQPETPRGPPRSR